MIPKSARYASIGHQIFRSLIVLALFGLMVASARAAAPFAVDNYTYAADNYRDTIANGIKLGIRSRLPAGDLLLDHLDGFRIEHDHVYITLTGDG